MSDCTPVTWSRTHCWDRPDWTVDELVAAKKGRTVSVVLPALNEEATVGSVVASIAPLLGGLVDELVVIDSNSTDATAEKARAAGATVIARDDVLPQIPARPGKGEALWRGVAATTGDLIVFIDADLVDPDPMFVPNLLGPLLTDRDPPRQGLLPPSAAGRRHRTRAGRRTSHRPAGPPPPHRAQTGTR